MRVRVNGGDSTTAIKLVTIPTVAGAVAIFVIEALAAIVVFHRNISRMSL